MLNGEEGEAVSQAMKILVKLGELYDAECMVEIQRAHVVTIYPQTGSLFIELLKKWAQLGGAYRVPTTIDPAGDALLEPFIHYELPHSIKENIIHFYEITKKLNIIPLPSCTPYLQGFSPIFSEHIAWTESSAVIFANSVIGARTNRLSTPIESAAAITGRIPKFGFHLDEERVGDILVKVQLNKIEDLDYSTIGYIVGVLSPGKVPVFTNMNKVTTYQLKNMGASMATVGGIGMYHVIGKTPEAKTMKEAFKNTCPEDKIEITQVELNKAEMEIGTIRKDKADMVFIGCPHLSLEEIKFIANLLQGKKIRKDVKFIIATSPCVKEVARRMGYLEVIEHAGAEVTNSCIAFLPLKEMGFDIVMTNSAKMCHIVVSPPSSVEAIYSNIEKCIASSIL